MARTKASVGAKVSSGKSSKARCSAAPPPTSGHAGSGDSSRSSSGGNSVCQRETPIWQRPITNFFITNNTSTSDDDNDSASSSKVKAKRNVIESDEEEIEEKEKEKPVEIKEVPINRELDETIELQPLNGEDSHKIDEYYIAKNKGKGKKSNKENEDVNRRSKRELEEDGSEQVSKRIKVD